MSKLFLSIAALLILSASVLAQKGTAENGYWPMGYSGDTWTGKVTGVNKDTREFTLTYDDGKKTQTFVVPLPVGYTFKMKDGSNHVVELDELIGLRLKVYYMNKTKKAPDGSKIKVIEAFLIKVMPEK